ncbi:tonB family domain protein [Sesbania bispinosa]|nr:tonB family domain protein [Sesbania bispinosa]
MHVYFEYPIDNPKIGQNPPNGAINDEDLCRIVDEIVRMTVEAHYLEGADNDICEHLGDGDNEGRKVTVEDDRGNGCSDEDKPYEALEDSLGDDYESASDSPYRPPLFESDD